MAEHFEKSSLFVLDLGQNGGVLAPESVDQLVNWLEVEEAFWQPLWSGSDPATKQALADSLRPLSRALELARESRIYLKAPAGLIDRARGLQVLDPVGNDKIRQVESLIKDLYMAGALPHSTSDVGRRIHLVRRAGPEAAAAYLLTQLPKENLGSFNSSSTASWAGFIAGLQDRYGLGYRGSEVDIQSQALTDLRGKAERALEELRNEHRAQTERAQKLIEDWAEQQRGQQAQFSGLVAAANVNHDEALARHRSEMEAIHHTFKEGMAIRAPIDYWTNREKVYRRRSTVLGVLLLALFLGGGGLLIWLALWALSVTHIDGSPVWGRMTVFVVGAVFAVWAVRLAVRMFLSDLHLAGDSAERVVMIQTYLALLEAEKVPADEDRKLVLQALFRPASDGIVRDEGPPHFLVEQLTRPGAGKS